MIEARTRTVYFSPAAGRHFMTLASAAMILTLPTNILTGPSFKLPPSNSVAE